MSIDLNSANAALRGASASAIVQWALALGKPAIATTSMGRNAAVMLHLVSAVDPGIPTVWVDTGYNLRETYVVAERLIRDLGLDIRVYSPLMTSERRNAIMGGIPTVDEEERHREFTRQVKLEPFASDAAWTNACAAITRNDPHTRGVVVLGLDAEESALAASLPLAARHDLVKGFAVGRTIFADAARAWLDGQITDARAVKMMAERYQRLCGIWDEARAQTGRTA